MVTAEVGDGTVSEAKLEAKSVQNLCSIVATASIIHSPNYVVTAEVPGMERFLRQNSMLIRGTSVALSRQQRPSLAALRCDNRHVEDGTASVAKFEANSRQNLG